jgi:arsenate reductase
MADGPYNVLFLCTGNSARSIIAEAILNKVGARTFRAYSAGSQPKGQVNPHTIQLLQTLGYDTSGYRSKSWDEFAKASEPKFDFVFTVCDNAAAEACPVWPGMTAHWGIPDPAEATGTPAEVALAFKDAYRLLNQRIGIFAALPLRALNQLVLQNRLHEIAQMEGSTAKADRAPLRTQSHAHAVLRRSSKRLLSFIEPLLALDQRQVAQVGTVMLDQVGGVQHRFAAPASALGWLWFQREDGDRWVAALNRRCELMVVSTDEAGNDANILFAAGGVAH